MGEVFWAFLRLGLTSFGGPVAHLGYFRTAFVTRRRWLDEAAYAELLSLCQFLPGPASSQVGFAVGLVRAGWGGGVAAWIGFTLPSALLMVAFAYGAGSIGATAAGVGVLHGMKLAAVAVVAQAVWGMARTLCPDRARAAIGIGALIAASLVPAAGGQFAIIVVGASAGLMLARGGEVMASTPAARGPVTRRAGVSCLAGFALLLLVSLIWPGGLAASFYRAGALVFGGGHVVLPMLREVVVGPGWITDSAFLAGYGATQAVPGPLFTFAAYLGALMDGGLGAATAVVALSLPGLLLTAGVLPLWRSLRARPAAQAAVTGANAAVVGLLGAAFYDPVWVNAVYTPRDFAIAASGFLALVIWRAPPLAVVAGCAVLGLAG